MTEQPPSPYQVWVWPEGWAAPTICLVVPGPPSLATPSSTVPALCSHGPSRSAPRLGVICHRVCLMYTDLTVASPRRPWGLALSLSLNPSLGTVLDSRTSGPLWRAHFLLNGKLLTLARHVIVCARLTNTDLFSAQNGTPRWESPSVFCQWAPAGSRVWSPVEARYWWGLVGLRAHRSHHPP